MFASLRKNRFFISFFVLFLYCLLFPEFLWLWECRSSIPGRLPLSVLYVLNHSVVSDSFDPKDCNPPGSSVHGILQAWILDSHSLLQGIFSTQGSNLGLLYCRQILYHLSYQGSPMWIYIDAKNISHTCPFWKKHLRKYSSQIVIIQNGLLKIGIDEKENK